MAEIYQIKDEVKEDSTVTLQTLLGNRNVPVSVEDDTSVCAARFHELVDKEFLGRLTAEEIKELEVLTKWRDDQKSAFYRNVISE